jgi:hypothetical protein
VPQLESADPPLPPVQFETKLNLPYDPDKSGPRAFLVCASPRWFEDMDTLRKLAAEVGTTDAGGTAESGSQWSEAKSPSEWEKILKMGKTTLKNHVKDGKLIVDKITSKSWRIRKDTLARYLGDK